MPYKERDIEKKYFSIGEVAAIFKVAPSLIRYWEGEFEMINPKKDKKGNRRFTKEDIEKIRYIYQLVKVKGFTLQGAQEAIKKDQSKVFDKVQMIDKLHQIKKFLVNIRDTMHVKPE
ncbi:MerR family transcriptional regulator [Belliella kenyensis]|uniref:MerR family transcriptional regulator n=1 Tax=Belliella kenyensis TaxID=1472724 RepID=A0ABV8EHY9_9BACT|nr:MerR family transcriptional regulator [Belliella kenyensis]MCH7401907.1 MerR family transcriptional regulator [Belliella kenyensis]MDN3604407.1 MerR family transcriptional regulator [Belliella kenyensis]